jgi:hypothetical protein
MYSAFYDNQEAKSQEIKQMLAEHLNQLFEQLASLPLRNGDTTDLLNRIRKTSIDG